MEFRVAIIGSGDMGRQHAAAWNSREDAKVVAVCDLLEDRRNDLAQSTGATPYLAYRDAITHEGVNVISICTPVCFHSEIGICAAEHGCHVLSEKPLALTLDQADAVIAAARANHVLLSTSLQYRGWPRYKKYRELFEQGAFEEPIFMRFADVREVRPKTDMHRKSRNGGPIIDMAGHYFDLARYITGKEPVSVYARGHIFGTGKPRLAGIDDLEIDAATIEVSMTGGHVLSVFVNWGMPEGFTGFGDEVIVGPGLSAKPVDGRIEAIYGSHVEHIELPTGPSGPIIRINGLVESILQGVPLEVSGEVGRIALSVSLAALESIRTDNSDGLPTPS